MASSKQTWLITGCSSGLGEAFSYAALKRGDNVIATARKGTQRLQALKEAGAATLDIDVQAPQAVLDSKADDALAICRGIAVLITNQVYIEALVLEVLSWLNRPAYRPRLDMAMARPIAYQFNASSDMKRVSRNPPICSYHGPAGGFGSSLHYCNVNTINPSSEPRKTSHFGASKQNRFIGWISGRKLLTATYTYGTPSLGYIQDA